MTNELLLVGTLVAYFGFMLLAYKLFGRAGLYGFTIFATVVGNIEVLLLVNAFGMDQTLGNVIFATTYSAAKILSEMEGEKGPDYAKKATWLSVGTTGVFMLITQTRRRMEDCSSRCSRTRPGSCFPAWWCMPSVCWCRLRLTSSFGRCKSIGKADNGSGQVYPPCLPSWLIPSSLRCSPSSVSMNLA